MPNEQPVKILLVQVKLGVLVELARHALLAGLLAAEIVQQFRDSWSILLGADEPLAEQPPEGLQPFVQLLFYF